MGSIGPVELLIFLIFESIGPVELLIIVGAVGIPVGVVWVWWHFATAYQRQRGYAEDRGVAAGGDMGVAAGGDMSEVELGGGESDEPEEVPEKAYPLIQCEGVVVAGEEFVLRIGLSEKAEGGVLGGQMARSDRERGPYELTMRVIAPGMNLRQGESWRQTCDVTARDPYPTIDLHLTPDGQGDGRLPAKIMVDYLIGSQPMGVGERNLVVIRDESFRAQAVVAPQEEAEFPVPALESAPDITVGIWRFGSDGDLQWTIELDKPLKDIKVEDDALITNIGGEPQNFTRRLVAELDTYGEAGADDEESAIPEIVSAFSSQIANKVPPQLWEILAQVRSRVNGPPVMLIMTQEPYVPWELAKVPDEHRDQELVPVLGAQATVSRWVLAPRPHPPATTAIAVKSIGIIAGHYPDNDELEGVEMEEEHMKNAYGAKSFGATKLIFMRFMRTTRDSIIHFAVHGKYDVHPTLDGIILEDETVAESFIYGSKLKAKPFVFINACQVGGSGRRLGEYSGMASAFLHAGASGVVAPLWSIWDKNSADLAREFYDNVFDGGKSVAEALRLQRGKFLKAGGFSSATCLAYLYYGHPALTLSR